MPEVVTTEAEESQNPAPEAEAEEQEATPTTDSDTTWKARLAGKDRALTAAKAEAERMKQEAEELRRWKAEKEQADMTEVERLTLQLQQLQSEKAAAEAAARSLALRAEFPLAADFLGDSFAALEAPSLAALEVKLKAQSEPEEPPVNPNNPPKVPRTGSPLTGSVADLKKQSDEALLSHLSTLGNPFLRDN